MKIKVKITREENARHFGQAIGAVAEMDIETYLLGVVPAEIGNAPKEACKAQAIAARTYALPYALKEAAISDASSTAQAYRAARANDSAYSNAHLSVLETSGMVLYYDGKLIATCSYSASNGGVTTSSESRWGGYRPYLIEQPDPWDLAATGGKKTGHGVGMSQEGAKYAAGVLGKSFGSILAFYYPGTVIRSGYGIEEQQGGSKESMEKTNIGLANWAREWLGQRYWYGTVCYKCTASQLASKANQYPSHYTESRMARYRQDIAEGRSAADCVGLIKGYLWEKDGKVTYNRDTDVSASGMFNKGSVKGPIHTIPEVPGLLVYAPGHIGVHIGNGEVIEAKGFAYGIVLTKLAEGSWTHWVACPWISYAGYEKQLEPEAFAGPYTAKVVTNSSPLNIWSSPAKSLSLLRVNKGDTVRVTGYGGQMGWLQVEKNGVRGVADSQYLQKIDELSQVGEPDDDMDDGLANSDHQETGVLYKARVVNVKTSLNLRTAPSLTSGNTILLMPRDAMVEVLGENYGSFAYVRYGGVCGYCTRSYLYQVEDEPGKLYNVTLAGVTADVLARVLELFPAAVVTET